MKKIAKIVLMLTFVMVFLTACGSEKTLTEHEQNKVTTAEARATNVINLTTALISSSDLNEMLNNYNNTELGDLFASTYAQFSGDTSFTCEGKAVNSALTSFQSGIEQMGSITDLGTPSSVIDGDTIVVTVPATGANTSGSIEIIFTNDIYLHMTSCTLNLDQSMGQLMGKAALNTLLGMGTVFAVLILISLIISCFNFIPKIQDSLFPSKAQKAPEAPKAPVAPVIVQEEEEDLSDDMELVAVIAAAIASYEGTSTEGFQVRSIRRANTNKWKRA